MHQIVSVDGKVFLSPTIPKFKSPRYPCHPATWKVAPSFGALAGGAAVYFTTDAP